MIVMLSIAAPFRAEIHRRNRPFSVALHDTEDLVPDADRDVLPTAQRQPIRLNLRLKVVLKLHRLLEGLNLPAFLKILRCKRPLFLHHWVTLDLCDDHSE